MIRRKLYFSVMVVSIVDESLLVSLRVESSVSLSVVVVVVVVVVFTLGMGVSSRPRMALSSQHSSPGKFTRDIEVRIVEEDDEECRVSTITK